MTTTPPPEEVELDEYICSEGHIGNAYTRPDKRIQCRTCKNERARESYERNKEQRKAEHDEYRKKNWERIKQLTYKRRDPLKAQARQAVNNAVAAGKFAKEACSVWDCGITKTDFHHTDGYDKEHWFTGIWLCRQHHLKLHKELRWKTS